MVRKGSSSLSFSYCHENTTSLCEQNVCLILQEAELEEEWLQEAGLSTLVSGTQNDGPTEALLSTLTHSQAAMVKKRLDNYTQTLRKRNRQPMRHVRDVFSTPDTSVSAEEKVGVFMLMSSSL